MENIEDRLLKFQFKKALLLKAIFHLEGSVPMKEMEEALQMGARVSEVINNIASGSFLVPPKRNIDEPKKEEVMVNSDIGAELTSQIKALTEMLEKKQKEISHIYGSYENLKTTIDSQVEIIHTKCNEVGAMVSSFQNEIYNTFTSNK